MVAMEDNLFTSHTRTLKSQAPDTITSYMEENASCVTPKVCPFSRFGDRKGASFRSHSKMEESKDEETRYRLLRCAVYLCVCVVCGVCVTIEREREREREFYQTYKSDVTASV